MLKKYRTIRPDENKMQALIALSNTLVRLSLDGLVDEYDCTYYYFTREAIDAFLIRWPLMKRIARLERLLGDESEE